MQRLKRCALAAAIASGLILALPLNAIAQAPDILLLDLCLNDRCAGIAPVAIKDGRVLVGRSDLVALGLQAEGAPSERIGQRDFVAVAAANPAASTHVDREGMRLDIDVAAKFLPPQRVETAPAPVIAHAAPAWSGFLNYAASYGSTRFDRSLYVDGAVGRGHSALRTTALWNEAQGWRRGLTRFEFDQVDHLQRWTLGDQFMGAGDPLGGGALIAGIGVERAFEQDPYLVTVPRPVYQGVLETPGTVEVYANGALLTRRELAAGPFSLEGLGITPGRNDVQVIVRDPFGNRTELASAYFYGSNSLLAPGLSDFAARIGLPRDGGLGGGYGEVPVWQGWYRRGINNHLTLGGRIEGDAHLFNRGLDATVGLGLGEISLSAARSDEDIAGRGDAWSLGYNFATPGWGLNLGTQRFDGAYRTVGQPYLLLDARLLSRDYANLSWSPVNRLSLQLSTGRSERETLGKDRHVGITGNWQLSNRASLRFGLERRRYEDRQDTIAQIGFSYSFEHEYLSVNVRRNGDSEGVGVDLRRSRPAGPGWGYDISLQRQDGFGTGFGQVEYQGAHGRYALQADRIEGEASARMLVSGALVAIGGRTFATPPVESGFALVQVPGQAGIPILRHNHEIGHTDAQGDLLVTGMIPYYPNKIALDESKVPVGYELVVEQREVAVPRNTGAIVGLEVAARQAVTGQLRVRRDGVAVPIEYGLLRLVGESGEHESLLGGEGRFYFEKLPPGRYAGTVESDGIRAACNVEVPSASAAGMVRLDTVTCMSERDDEIE